PTCPLWSYTICLLYILTSNNTTFTQTASFLLSSKSLTMIPMANFFSSNKIAPFKFKYQTHFVASSDGTTLQVYVLTMTPGSPSIRKTNFKQVADIHPHAPNLTAVTKDMKTCNGLHFSNDRGKIEGEEALITLAQHLSQLRLLVNPYGYCLQDVVQLRMYTDYQIHYLRLNDLFRWSNYGVETAATTKSSATHDDRSVLNHWVPERALPITRYKVVSQDTYDEREEELQDLRLESEKQSRRIKESKSYFESELKKKDIEVNRWTDITKTRAEQEESVKQKEMQIEMLLKEKQEAEEYMKVWKQRIDNATSYIPPVVNGGAAVLDAAYVTATGVGSVAYAAGSATIKKAGEVGAFIAANTPAARKAAADAEAERREKERQKNMARYYPYPGPPRN
ncbi:hypothetical protein LINGRAHAP2_LOCUS8544, partial [Linum grandiflorum]